MLILLCFQLMLTALDPNQTNILSCLARFSRYLFRLLSFLLHALNIPAFLACMLPCHSHSSISELTAKQTKIKKRRTKNAVCLFAYRPGIIYRIQKSLYPTDFRQIFTTKKKNLITDFTLSYLVTIRVKCRLFHIPGCKYRNCNVFFSVGFSCLFILITLFARSNLFGGLKSNHVHS